MSDSESGSDENELEAIRERKKEQLRRKLEHGDLDEGDTKTDGSQDSMDETKNAPSEPIRLDDPNRFDTVVSEYDTVLVDFYADWCGPCQMMEPAVAAIARDTDAAVLKVDIDRQQGLAGQFGVRSVPTLVLFRNGDPAQRVMGAQSEAALKRLVSTGS